MGCSRCSGMGTGRCTCEYFCGAGDCRATKRYPEDVLVTTAANTICTWCTERRSHCTCQTKCGALECEAPKLVDPTEADLQDPEFEAIWDAIKGWDITRPGSELTGGATGTDVMTILNALRSERLLVETIRDISRFSNLNETTIRDLLKKGWIYRREVGRPDRLEKIL